MSCATCSASRRTNPACMSLATCRSTAAAYLTSKLLVMRTGTDSGGAVSTGAAAAAAAAGGSTAGGCPASSAPAPDAAHSPSTGINLNTDRIDDVRRSFITDSLLRPRLRAATALEVDPAAVARFHSADGIAG